ncbi:hypothetical protein EVAR_20556_1 [Eumeta japonica]|uniref:Uncharacterized protein n=1 Tax=Eumeta variegata TaxID=151549 RepID=A0A4C1URW0_EUMVA|nr:hypothetical protein EVAR_20556_1 [Eumeta japonica]
MPNFSTIGYQEVLKNGLKILKAQLTYERYKLTKSGINHIKNTNFTSESELNVVRPLDEFGQALERLETTRPSAAQGNLSLTRQIPLRYGRVQSLINCLSFLRA